MDIWLVSTFFRVKVNSLNAKVAIIIETSQLICRADWFLYETLVFNEVRQLYSRDCDILVSTPDDIQ